MSHRGVLTFAWCAAHLVLGLLTAGLSLFITVPWHVWDVTFGRREERRQFDSAGHYYGKPKFKKISEEQVWMWMKK